MSRSKRLVGVADATPLVWFAAPYPFHMLQKSVSYSRVLLACLAGRQSMIPCWEALFARFLAGSGRQVRTNSSRKLL